MTELPKSTAPNTTDQRVTDAATRLLRASESRVPCNPVRDLLDADIGLAYEVQRELVGRRIATGKQAVGRKIGLTSPAVQLQLGVDQPDSGVLFDDMAVPAGGVASLSRLLQPKIEAEVAFVLCADLSGGWDDPKQLRASIAYTVAALEIVDSRIRDWDITITDTVADNASCGLFVLSDRHVPLDEFVPADIDMQLALDEQVVSTGRGSACLGDPLNALAWLARKAAELGDPLRAGEVVLSGALGPMVTVHTDCAVSAEIGALGRVDVRFSSLEDA
jgi:2-keto-4-pentenoate hydratase